MKSISARTIIRWLHLLMGIPIIGYIYSPPLQDTLCRPRPLRLCAGDGPVRALDWRADILCGGWWHVRLG